MGLVKGLCGIAGRLTGQKIIQVGTKDLRLAG